jgi:hypothetical protein
MNFVFNPGTGSLRLPKSSPTPRGTPAKCVSDYRDLGGRQIPHRMAVHHAGEVYGQIEWTKIELTPAAKEQP